MLLGLHFLDHKFAKIEIWRKRFPRFFGKNDFMILFSWVRIKSPFPLFSPSSTFIKVLIRYICCFKRIRNYRKQRSIVGKTTSHSILGQLLNHLCISGKKGALKLILAVHLLYTFPIRSFSIKSDSLNSIKENF